MRPTALLTLTSSLRFLRFALHCYSAAVTLVHVSALQVNEAIDAADSPAQVKTIAENNLGMHSTLHIA
jgi:hypothetical protein